MTEETKQAVATTTPPTFVEQLAEYKPQIKAALPAHIPVERFERVVVTAINRAPELAEADRRSLFTACVSAAQDGLLPDGKEAALVIFNSKVGSGDTERWVKKVQYMPMIAGIRKRMRNSGEVLSAESHVIYANDKFDYELGDSPSIEHKPAFGDRADPIGAYAVIKLKSGEVLREVMSYDEIEYVRSVSKARNSGPWTKWWGEMARKTVLRRCAKAAPVQTDLDALLSRADDDDPAEPLDITPRPKGEDFAGSAPDAEDADELESEVPFVFFLADENGEIIAQPTSAAEYADALIALLEVEGTDFHAIMDANEAALDALCAEHEEGCYGPVMAVFGRLCAAEKRTKSEPAGSDTTAGQDGDAAGAGPDAPAAEDGGSPSPDPASTNGAPERDPKLMYLINLNGTLMLSAADNQPQCFKRSAAGTAAWAEAVKSLCEKNPDYWPFHRADALWAIGKAPADTADALRALLARMEGEDVHIDKAGTELGPMDAG